MKKRVVFTGIGVLASNGKNRAEYWAALKEGRVGYGPISLFDTKDFSVKQAAEIKDFDPKVYLGAKGLRTMDRTSKMLVSAARLAVEDSRLTITEENTDDFGVSVGTTLGSLRSIVEFDEITLKEGPRYTNPALFPNTVINSPASQVSIWHNIQGFNTTISTGFTSSIDAMEYAYDFIQFERVKVVLAGSVEEVSLQIFLGFNAVEFLSGSKPGEQFINCPFDARRNGITLGEGASILVMEEYEYAKARGATMLAEVIGFGSCFDPTCLHKFNPRATGLKEAICAAMDDAGVGINDIDYICANANSTIAADKIETLAIKKIFGKQAYKIPISAIKSMIGETYSVCGSMAAAASIGAINEGFVPPTVNYKEKDRGCDLDYVPNKARLASLKNVLIITFGPEGKSACMILRRMM